jgi:chemotaxis protein methyltransferase CheR
MLDAISTNETHFFREPKHFELLQSSILPRWVAEAEAGRTRRIRAWSAGCSSGQEPYSLAMVLLQRFPRDCGWEIEVIATDLSTRVLEVAQRGIWPAEKTRDIPPEFLRLFMLKGRHDQAGKVKAGPEIQSVIRFFRLNLNDSSYAFPDKFDLIFCRNVLIYFDLRSREDILHRLVNCLSPGGYIFLGHAETMPRTLNNTLQAVSPTVYQLGGRLGQNNGPRE